VLGGWWSLVQAHLRLPDEPAADDEDRRLGLLLDGGRRPYRPAVLAALLPGEAAGTWTAVFAVFRLAGHGQSDRVSSVPFTVVTALLRQTPGTGVWSMHRSTRGVMGLAQLAGQEPWWVRPWDVGVGVLVAALHADHVHLVPDSTSPVELYTGNLLAAWEYVESQYTAWRPSGTLVLGPSALFDVSVIVRVLDLFRPANEVVVGVHCNRALQASPRPALLGLTPHGRGVPDGCVRMTWEHGLAPARPLRVVSSATAWDPVLCLALPETRPPLALGTELNVSWWLACWRVPRVDVDTLPPGLWTLLRSAPPVCVLVAVAVCMWGGHEAPPTDQPLSFVRLLDDSEPGQGPAVRLGFDQDAAVSASHRLVAHNRPPASWTVDELVQHLDHPHAYDFPTAFAEPGPWPWPEHRLVSAVQFQTGAGQDDVRWLAPTDRPFTGPDWTAPLLVPARG
jgi:hypothetical protein